MTGKPIEAFSHIEFRHIAAHARLCRPCALGGRVGDATPYAKCILVCG